MDDIVKAALKKWPNVPDCYGWLALDARGDWYMRDDRIQAAGPFPQIKGSRVEHELGSRETGWCRQPHVPLGARERNHQSRRLRSAG